MHHVIRNLTISGIFIENISIFFIIVVYWNKASAMAECDSVIDDILTDESDMILEHDVLDDDHYSLNKSKRKRQQIVDTWSNDDMIQLMNEEEMEPYHWKAAGTKSKYFIK